MLKIYPSHLQVLPLLPFYVQYSKAVFVYTLDSLDIFWNQAWCNFGFSLKDLSYELYVFVMIDYLTVVAKAFPALNLAYFLLLYKSHTNAKNSLR